MLRPARLWGSWTSTRALRALLPFPIAARALRARPGPPGPRRSSGPGLRLLARTLGVLLFRRWDWLIACRRTGTAGDYSCLSSLVLGHPRASPLFFAGAELVDA